jgi:sigma-B regulation protein RsbU (phosphoserine phosphatase)
MVQTAVRTLLASGHYESRKFFEVLNTVVYDNARRMNCARNLSLSLLHYEDKVVTISGQHEEVLIVRENGVLERHDTLDLGFPLGLEAKISQYHFSRAMLWSFTPTESPRPLIPRGLPMALNGSAR